jgi:hypothetical protein
MATFFQKQALQSCKQIIPGANSYFLILYHGFFRRNLAKFLNLKKNDFHLSKGFVMEKMADIH